MKFCLFLIHKHKKGPRRDVSGVHVIGEIRSKFGAEFVAETEKPLQIKGFLVVRIIPTRLGLNGCYHIWYVSLSILSMFRGVFYLIRIFMSRIGQPLVTILWVEFV